MANGANVESAENPFNPCALALVASNLFLTLPYTHKYLKLLATIFAFIGIHGHYDLPPYSTCYLDPHISSLEQTITVLLHKDKIHRTHSLRGRIVAPAQFGQRVESPRKTPSIL
jgi:hypothetical protein